MADGATVTDADIAISARCERREWSWEAERNLKFSLDFQGKAERDFETVFLVCGSR